ncbi:MAG: Trm112 family protein [Candidatus Hodarchaeota archaeon]
MKPWLFDILACPIDKYFPLKLYIFSFLNKPEEFQSIINDYKKRDLIFIKNEGIIDIYNEGEELLLKDNIVIEKTNIKTYLKLIISSINEFESLNDNSTNIMSKRCFELVKSDIKQKIIEYSKKLDFKEFETILPELYFVNKIKLDIDIKSGILFCSNCKRWYPIIETIPQMLPDKYRNEKQEIEFLKTNKNLLDEKFFDQDLKPFNILKNSRENKN